METSKPTANVKKNYNPADLLYRKNYIFNKIAEERGPNMSYCESMDGSLIPELLSLFCESEEAEYAEFIQDYHFMAEQDGYLPASLSKATIDEIKHYARDNRTAILTKVRETLDAYAAEYGIETLPVLKCPYCESEDVLFVNNQLCGRYECQHCGSLFDEEEIEYEEIRHKLSLLLDGTDIKKTKPCRISLDDETEIMECHQIPGDGTIWFHVDQWVQLDNFTLEQAKLILEMLQKK